VNETLGLKMKLIASIVAISGIHLLKRFMEIGETSAPLDEPQLMWLVIIHLTFVGSGVKTVATGRVMGQGNLTQTDKEYDLSVRGDGFFRVRMPDGRTAYTRDGSFDLDSQGQLVTKDGYIVEPGINVPQNARSVSISSSGQVQALIPGQTAPQDLGQIQLSRFVNRVGLESVGDNLFVETAGSGPAIDGNPGGEGFGSVQQSYLEESNVNAVVEISSLIAAQRAYEMNSRVISASDQMMQATSQMFRG
jgi:flagellar basal-body rod protein FlgG